MVLPGGVSRGEPLRHLACLTAMLSLASGLVRSSAGRLQQRRRHSGILAAIVEEQPVRNPLDSSSNVLVVGASRGIGTELVRQCLAKGASVIATHRGSAVPSALEELRAEAPDRLSTLELDCSDPASIEGAAQSMHDRPARLTHVIHNAGIYGSQVSISGKSWGSRPAANPVTKEIMMEVFETNAVGPLLVAQAMYPFFAPAPGQQPVYAFLTSKVGSIVDNGSGGAYAYRASKIALNMIAKSLSVDFKGIASVVLLHPGYVRTDMTGGNGLIDADESVAGMLRAVEATDSSMELRWVDYKAEVVPW